MINLMLSSVWVGVLSFFFVAISVLMILFVLIQRPKGGGLSGAFGGAGGGSTAVFGAKTGDILTWLTVSFFVIFLLLGIFLNFATQAANKNVSSVDIVDSIDPTNEGTAPTNPANPSTETPGDSTKPSTGTDTNPIVPDAIVPDTTPAPKPEDTTPAPKPADTAPAPKDDNTGAGN